MKEAMLYKKLKGKNVRCNACSHYCVIKLGAVGICGVRKNINGILYLEVYGKAAAVHMDPIEKKPFFHFLPGSDILSIGTYGCNFGCGFCQNWGISQTSKEQGINSLGSSNFYPKDIVDYCIKNKVKSIAFTYNEPAILFEYAYDTFKLAKKKKIKTVFVSNGYESKECLNKIAKYLDAINIDLKSFSDDFYKKVCKARLKPVLETIKLVKKLGIWQEITTLLIPGQNNSVDELRKIVGFIASVDKNIPWHISAFHPDYKMLEIKPTSKEELLKACSIGKKAGLKYIYVGNIEAGGHEKTYCPGCEKIVIDRAGYSIKSIDLKNGKCKFCGTKIKGVWK